MSEASSKPYEIRRHEMQPYFDLEAFMSMSKETRLGGAILERLVGLWGEWLPQLNVCEIAAGKNFVSGCLAAGRSGKFCG